MIAGFYQLARRPVEAVLPSLVTRALAAGHRLLVRCDDAALLARLDEQLWSFSPPSFVPHGREGSIAEDRLSSQPVLLGARWPPANRADCLVQVLGNLPDDLTGMARLLYLFGEADVEAARGHWRRLKAMDGIVPTYWREGDSGAFEKAG
ncbi:DNA polymerase III subunit chi [Polymorphobacter sp.]|uniref:DNA polymerase III subunit chi n=1 Tax=Polymorphobacter sp. TaxID=1909290 RepID=UPI003F71A187